MVRRRCYIAVALFFCEGNAYIFTTEELAYCNAVFWRKATDMRKKDNNINSHASKFRCEEIIKDDKGLNKY